METTPSQNLSASRVALLCPTLAQVLATTETGSPLLLDSVDALRTETTALAWNVTYDSKTVASLRWHGENLQRAASVTDQISANLMLKRVAEQTEELVSLLTTNLS